LYVQGPDVKTDTIGFSEVQKVNSAVVKLGPGKIFLSATKTNHKFTLPQRDDRVKYRNATVKVTGLKLNERGHLGAGMLVVGTNVETDEKVTARLANLVSIQRASGDELFDLKAFKSQFHDYLGSETGATA
jgi:hypothetical protein